jgi:ATP-dependent Clp protease ATP-binding subunit ClpA/CheY-like chemotaxis protein
MDDFSTSALSNLEELLSQKIVGQPDALRKIVPYVRMYQAGLSPVGRPAGVFLLLGTTGTGKTRTVEALADVLHGSGHKVLRIDCGEFQMEHEVVKLLGAPPGYIGHRETTPILTEQRLKEASSERCDLALVLFDEIEKAAPSLARLLLGILDKARIRLGDNTEVSFENTLIFFTSNLGAREMTKEIQPGIGFRPAAPPNWPELAGKLEDIALGAVRKMYSPEFVNRLDAVITYQPLGEEAFAAILDQELVNLQNHVNTRLGDKCFSIEVPEESRRFLVERGTSTEYGARELKRTIHRYLTQPLATLVIEGKIEPGAGIQVLVERDNQTLQFSPLETPQISSTPTLLIVDDNRDFLRLLSLQLGKSTPWRLLTAQSVAEAREAVKQRTIDFALLDLVLPDGNGVKLGRELKLHDRNVRVIVMTGGELTFEEDQARRSSGFKVVTKPFLVSDLIGLIQGIKVAAVASR